MGKRKRREQKAKNNRHNESLKHDPIAEHNAGYGFKSASKAAAESASRSVPTVPGLSEADVDAIIEAELDYARLLDTGAILIGDATEPNTYEDSNGGLYVVEWDESNTPKVVPVGDKTDFHSGQICNWCDGEMWIDVDDSLFCPMCDCKYTPEGNLAQGTILTPDDTPYLVPAESVQVQKPKWPGATNTTNTVVTKTKTISGEKYDSWWRGKSNCCHWQDEVEIVPGVKVYCSGKMDAPSVKDPAYTMTMVPDLGVYFDSAWGRGGTVVTPGWRGPKLAPDYPMAILPWPDWSVPVGKGKIDTLEVLRYAVDAACAGKVVEIGCLGGHGRTGTALPIMKMMMGIPADQSMLSVWNNYCEWAIESLEQEKWITRSQGWCQSKWKN